MSQAEKATRLANLHQKGNPLVLYNIWDAASAKAVAQAGAPVFATGSWSMAAAQGYEDGEAIPLSFVLKSVARICASVDVPVTVDFEGGYAIHPDQVGDNIRKLIRTGAVGLNFEDRVVQGAGLHPISAQVARIRAIKSVAADAGVSLVVNARTDLFLGTDPARQGACLEEALEREAAYAEAGADCFFVPGLTDGTLISELTEKASLPINVMMGDLTSIKEVASFGVSRASYGPVPMLACLAHLKSAYGSLE
ncbi:MAG: isocitrate lyase/phosphoenolpyruvate mutase family protein [Pseudomonadota bacterium]